MDDSLEKLRDAALKLCISAYSLAQTENYGQPRSHHQNNPTVGNAAHHATVYLALSHALDKAPKGDRSKDNG